LYTRKRSSDKRLEGIRELSALIVVMRLVMRSM
jgi:hypothetical protein